MSVWDGEWGVGGGWVGCKRLIDTEQRKQMDIFTCGQVESYWDE